MAESYFNKFPTTHYNNTKCRDITRRVKIDEKTRDALTLYYTYDVRNGTRADMITDIYYEDPELDWMLWLTNYMIDPYYQWNLSEDDFNGHLVKKYGSVENSIKKIAYYRNNWYNDDQVITPDFYTDNLDKDWKKYYGPFYGEGVKVLYWKRREEDWLMETNQIWKLTVANTTPFANGELVDVKNNIAVRVGGGEVTSKSNTYIMIKNIDGAFSNSNIVTGETSQDPQELTLNGDLVYQAIANSEAIFWSPVTYYDIENEKNAYARTINILDRSQLPNTLEQLQKLIKE